MKYICSYFLLFINFSNLCHGMESATHQTPPKPPTSTQDWIDRIKEGGPMPHWSSLQAYLDFRGQKKKYLVVGCGHGAFSYNADLGKISGVHGYDLSSSTYSFSHPDAFTINANDGQPGASRPLFPDIKGYFPRDLGLTSDEIFDEIYFEKVDSNTGEYYKAAFQLLKPGGTLVNDRYTGDLGSTHFRKSVAIEALIEAGFSNIIFEDNITNKRNNRKNTDLVLAIKLEQQYNASAFEEDKFLLELVNRDVDKLKNEGKFNNVTLNDLLRGYYRNIPKIFKELYFKYRIDVRINK